MQTSKDDIKLYNEDCLKIMRSIPDESIDLFLVDCPYHIIESGTGRKELKGDEPSGIFARRNNKNAEDMMAGKMFKYNDIEFKEWLPDAYRILKKGTHAYIMINARNLKDLQVEAEKVGFEFQQLIVWKKNNCLMSQWYMNCYELILMLKKGIARPINNCGSKNIIEVDNIIGDKLHPSQKPIELMKILIENSTKEGEIVIDCFMGSGATGVACKELGRKFIGIEIDKEYFDIAKARIEEGKTRKQIQNPNEQSIFDYI